MLLVRPAAGVSSGGAAFGLSSEGGGQDEICGESPASPVRVKAGAPRVRTAEKDQTVHFSWASVLSFSLFPLVSSFLELHGSTSLDVSVGGKKARLTLLRGAHGWRRRQSQPGEGARETREVGSGEEGGERGVRASQACRLPALPSWVLDGPLCRQGTSLLVCVIEFVHVVLCMIFVRLQSRGGAP